MKATGIVRRIDDLGRVVIPKEIRRTMRIREGETLQVYTDINSSLSESCFWLIFAFIPASLKPQILLGSAALFT